MPQRRAHRELHPPPTPAAWQPSTPRLVCLVWFITVKLSLMIKALCSQGQNLHWCKTRLIFFKCTFFRQLFKMKKSFRPFLFSLQAVPAGMWNFWGTQQEICRPDVLTTSTSCWQWVHKRTRSPFVSFFIHSHDEAITLTLVSWSRVFGNVQWFFQLFIFFIVIFTLFVLGFGQNGDEPTKSIEVDHAIRVLIQELIGSCTCDFLKKKQCEHEWTSHRYFGSQHVWASHFNLFVRDCSRHLLKFLPAYFAIGIGVLRERGHNGRDDAFQVGHDGSCRTKVSFADLWHVFNSNKDGKKGSALLSAASKEDNKCLVLASSLILLSRQRVNMNFLTSKPPETPHDPPSATYLAVHQVRGAPVSVSPAAECCWLMSNWCFLTAATRWRCLLCTEVIIVAFQVLFTYVQPQTSFTCLREALSQHRQLFCFTSCLIFSSLPFYYSTDGEFGPNVCFHSVHDPVFCRHKCDCTLCCHSFKLCCWEANQLT